jgi:peptidoglycan L-alanyl-D-glutamate endopeptidase CwlK
VLNARSLKNLAGVHPDLVRVVEAASERCVVPFVVTEGLRTKERQAQLVAAGKSQTLNGRHLTGHAVDVVDADNFGYEMPDLEKIAAAMKGASTELGIPIVWGGDWKWKDTPHFELCRKTYPASGVTIKDRAVEVAGKAAKARSVVAVAGGAVAVVAENGVPAVPPKVVESMTNVAGWVDASKGLKGSGGQLWGDPILLGVLMVIAAIVLAPKLMGKRS